MIFETYESYKNCRPVGQIANLLKVVRIYKSFSSNMSNRLKKKRLDDITAHILDLPEQIFRIIFLYLDDHAMFSFKNICNKVNHYVNNYVEVERRFLVLYLDRRFAMKRIHMIKLPNRNPCLMVIKHALFDGVPGYQGIPKQEKGIRANMAQSSLSISNQPSIFQKHAFTTTIQQRTVIGIYYAHVNQLMGRFVSTTFYLYLLNAEENKWTRMLPNPPEENKLPEYDSMDFSSQITWTPISELDTVVFHYNHRRNEYFIQLIHFHVNEDDAEWKYSSSWPVVPKGLRSLRGFFLGQKARGEIILFGGFSDRRVSNCPNNCVWDGALSLDGTAIIWNATNHVLPDTKLCCQLMFYLNDNIYILKDESKDGKLSTFIESYVPTICHKYSLKDKKYYEGVFRFPKPWYAISGQIYRNLVSIDKNNKFALIVARKHSMMNQETNNDDSRRFLYFTEKEGFQEVLKSRSKGGNTRNLRSKNTEQNNTKNSIIFVPQPL